MTIAAQVKQTVASLKGTKATLDTFYSFEQVEGNKDLLERNLERVGHIIDRLEKQVKTLEFEEPQYKGF